MKIDLTLVEKPDTSGFYVVKYTTTYTAKRNEEGIFMQVPAYQETRKALATLSGTHPFLIKESIKSLEDDKIIVSFANLNGAKVQWYKMEFNDLDQL